jgi:Tol biopolymer transport system component/plastocyanin
MQQVDRGAGSVAPCTGIRRLLVMATLAVALCAAATAQAKSTDSEAPPNAPPHWLAPEDWVYNHWLPYDEGRLYKLLHVDRGDIWRQLRDDRHNIAQLARRRGWSDPAKLAAALIAPREPTLTPRRIRELRHVALRTLTQGHLAQHLFFHSLHQFAIPSEAPSIFGVTDAQLSVLRRGEQSPLEIGRRHGRSPARIAELSAAVLRERIRAGIAAQAMTRRQGRILLRRQLSQLPRWLAQVRYNGPPTTHHGELVGKPRDYAANPALSANGSRVVFEACRQKLPLALAKGEISVALRSLAGAADALDASQPSDARATPRSAYNPTVSRDGRLVAFESAEGNLNFAKRYGQIEVFVRDTVAGRTRPIGGRATGAGLSRSEYDPALAADGSHLAYQAVRAGGESAVWVCDLKTGRSQLASRAVRNGAGANAAVFEPTIAGDGRKVAFTSGASNLGAGNLKDRTQVFVRDLVRRTTTLVSRADGRRGAVADDYSSEPSISQDGRFVAFASAADNLDGAPSENDATRVYVRDLRRDTTLAVTDRSDGFVLNPSISADGGRVAYASVEGDRARVLVRDVRAGRGPAQLVSRATGRRGAAADGTSADPSISADGRRVAFSSLATNLAPGKPDDRRGVFVRDLEHATTTLVSAAVAPGTVAANPAKTAAAVRRRARTLAHERADEALVSIVDNAFHRSVDRPLVRLHRGGRIRWRWDSQQSIRSARRFGPRRLRSPTRNNGSFSARLSAPGRYVFVCSIHAPGMHMTVDVR